MKLVSFLIPLLLLGCASTTPQGIPIDAIAKIPPEGTTALVNVVTGNKTETGIRFIPGGWYVVPPIIPSIPKQRGPWDENGHLRRG